VTRPGYAELKQQRWKKSKPFLGSFNFGQILSAYSVWSNFDKTIKETLSYCDNIVD
jgi:hypothetical protein